jgi:hypothetical protein
MWNQPCTACSKPECRSVWRKKIRGDSSYFNNSPRLSFTNIGYVQYDTAAGVQFMLFAEVRHAIGCRSDASRPNKGLDPSSFLPQWRLLALISPTRTRSHKLAHGHGAETCPSRVIISRWAPGPLPSLSPPSRPFSDTDFLATHNLPRTS